MTLAATTWVPGFEQHLAPHGDGGAYTDEFHVKFVWHTSETAPGSLDGIVADMLDNNHTDTYHVAADPKLRRIAQFLPLNISASALAHPPSVETNHDGAIQVCIIGRAHDMPGLSAIDVDWLGRAVLAPIARCVPELHLDIAATFYADTCGFTLASPTARQRMAPAVWDNFNGQCGHQHVPGNDHWDPGGLDVRSVTAAAHRALDPATTTTEEPMLFKPARGDSALNFFTGAKVDIAAMHIGVTGDCHISPDPSTFTIPGPWMGAIGPGDDPKLQPGEFIVVGAGKHEYKFTLT